jgi:hypothetical protein
LFQSGKSPPKRLFILVVFVFIALSLGVIFMGQFFLPHLAQGVSEPRFNGYSVTSDGSGFVLIVTNTDRHVTSVTGWVDVHSSNGTLCFTFEGSTTLNGGQSGTLIANLSYARDGSNMSAPEIYAASSVYQIEVRLAVPQPA